MYALSIGSFVLAAVAGLVMGVTVLTKKTFARSWTVIHGIFAVTGVVLLISIVLKAAAPAVSLDWALGIFVVAALGGATLLAIDLMGKKLPPALLMVHALAAVTALVVLIVSAVTGTGS